MAEVKIVDKTKNIEKQRENADTYQCMIKELTDKLKSSGIEVSVDDEGIKQMPIHIIRDKAQSKLARIVPCSLEETSSLTQILFDVYDERVFDCVIEMSNSFHDRYHFLERIEIETYFKQDKK